MDSSRIRGYNQVRVNFSPGTPERTQQKWSDRMAENLAVLMTTDPDHAAADKWVVPEDPDDKLESATRGYISLSHGLDALAEQNGERIIKLGTELHRKLWNALTRRNRTFSPENPKAHVDATSKPHPTKPGVMTFNLLTGKLAERFQKLFDRSYKLDEQISKTGYVFDEDSPGSKWVKLADDLITDDECEKLKALAAEEKKISEKLRRLHKRLADAKPSAYLDINLVDLFRKAQLQLSRNE